MIRSRSWAISVALFALVLAVEPARAAGRQSGANRQSQEKAARKACLTGDWASGVSLLADLFVEYKSPIYVFNQARCLEQNTCYGDAIARFDEYLRIGEISALDPADRAAAQKHIAEKAQVAFQPVPRPIPQADANPQVIEKPKAEPEPPQSGKGLIVGGIVAGSVGVAAVAAGVAFALKANSLVDEMQTTVNAYTSDKNSSQRTYATLAWVGYGVGAACIATGAILIAVGSSRRDSSTKSDLALVPAIGAGQVGVLFRGGF